jgi:hypothetical protein
MGSAWAARCRPAASAAIIWGLLTVPPLAAGGAAADLFESSAVPRLEIRLGDDSANSLREDPRRWVPCALVEIVPGADGKEGEEIIHDEVAIRLKGAAGSFQSLDEKPGLTLNMDAWRPGRRFHGLDKFHLNNAVQDPTWLHEWLGGEIFRAAGIPAARVTHARVILDGRDLGIHVLKEALDRDFLQRHFDRPDGNLYDGNGVDLDELTERDAGRSGPPGADVARLVAACRTGDPAARPAALGDCLDVDAFIDFMALELMTGHWDGYTVGRNNYRLYFDPARDGRAVFIPHGMDQLFGDSEAAILDLPGTIAAGAVMGVPEWRTRFREQVRRRLPLFEPAQLLPAIDAVAARLRPAVTETGAESLAAWEEALGDLRARIAARHTNLVDQAAAPESEPASFDGARRMVPTGWQPRVDSGQADLEESDGEDGRRLLGIACAAGTEVVASWRVTVPLPPGRYLFQGLARGEGIDALDDPQGSGAGLRISGGVRTLRVEGDGRWTMLGYQFDVDAAGPVELVAELRARGGRVHFNAESLVLVRLSDP